MKEKLPFWAFYIGNPGWSQKLKISKRGFVNQPSPVFVTAHPFSRYLAPLGAKYLEKKTEKILKKND